MARKKKKVNVWDFLDPLEGGLIVTEPRAVGTREELQTSETGKLYIPQESNTIRATYGCVCKVLKAAEDMKEAFPEGSGLLIHEFGGHPIYGDDSLTRAWIISEGDIMAKVADKYWSHYGA